MANHFNLSKSILLLCVFFFTLSCQSDQEKTKPTYNHITESVYASITVSPELSYFPFTSKAGLINKILIEEGDTVKKGQILFHMTSSQADSRLLDAQIDLAQTKANYQGAESLLKSIQLEIETQKQKMMLDSLNFKRQENLWNQKIGTAIDYDRAKVTYQSSRNTYKSLKEKYGQTAINLRNSYQKAVNRVNSEQKTLMEFTVKSEINGRVYNVFKEVGELLSLQEPFAEIGSLDEFKITMDIDEIDITKINVGDKVVVSLDAYPNEVFEATITKIFPKKEELTQTFKVESHFIHNPPKLYNGLSGEANIVISRRENVLTIPTDYLLPGNVVMTKDGEKSVKIGIKNMEFVEIVAGLDSNSIIVKSKK